MADKDTLEGDYPIPRKPFGKELGKSLTRKKIEYTIKGLDFDRFIGFFSCEAALGVYLFEHCQSGAGLEPEFMSAKVRNPVLYAQCQIELGTVTVLYDRYGLWAFNAVIVGSEQKSERGKGPNSRNGGRNDV